MLIFIISFVLTAIIAACFFKNKFWENRYLVLLIGAGVALVATLTTNFIVRGHLERKVETVWTKSLHTFYLPDTVLVDSIGCERTFLVDYDWYSEHNAPEFYYDSTKMQVPVSIVLYTDDKKGKNKYFGVFKSPEKQRYYEYNSTFLASSGNDTIIYVSKKKLVYSIAPTNWLTGFSFPRIKTATILYIPPKEYAMIPDSLIRKVPF
jgi:hypothetical protein